MPPTELTSPFQTVIWPGSARKGAAGPGIGQRTTHFSRKDGGVKGRIYVILCEACWLRRKLKKSSKKAKL